MTTSLFNKKRKNKGFTIAETLVAAGIISILTLVLIQFLLGYNKSFGIFNANVDVSSSAGRVITETSAAAREASAVLASRLFSDTTYTSSATSLVLQLPSVDATGAAIFGKYDYIAFYLEGANAYKRTEVDVASTRPAGVKLLSETVNSLTFTYDNANFALVQKIDIDIETEKQVKDEVSESHLRQQVYLRNK